MAWMESVGCLSCTRDNSAAEATPYLLSKNKSSRGKKSKRRAGLKFVAKRTNVKDEFRAAVTI